MIPTTSKMNSSGQVDGKEVVRSSPDKTVCYDSRSEDARALLHQMKPFLKSLERKGALLETFSKAFEGGEGVLIKRLQTVFPIKWIRAPNQEIMMDYNWSFQKAIGDDDRKRQLDFKDNRIFLGGFYKDKEFDGVQSSKRKRQIHRQDLSITRTSVEYVIKGAGCPCCGGNEKHEFTLLFNPGLMKYKLLVQETVTAYCCSSDNIEQVYDEFDFVAYSSEICP